MTATACGERERSQIAICAGAPSQISWLIDNRKLSCRALQNAGSIKMLSGAKIVILQSGDVTMLRDRHSRASQRLQSRMETTKTAAQHSRKYNIYIANGVIQATKRKRVTHLHRRPLLTRVPLVHLWPCIPNDRPHDLLAPRSANSGVLQT